MQLLLLMPRIIIMVTNPNVLSFCAPWKFHMYKHNVTQPFYITENNNVNIIQILYDSEYDEWDITNRGWLQQTS